MTQSEQIEGFGVDEIDDVIQTPGNGVGIAMNSAQRGRFVLFLDHRQTVELTELLLTKGPPALGEEIQLTFSDQAQGEVDVDEVLVDTQEQSANPFQISFRVGKNQPFTMRLSHREVIRWYRRLGAEITGYVRRKAN